MTRVTVIDYLGNLGSVSRALEWLGAEPEVTDEPQKVLDATHLILPGDGAFGYGMQQLRDKELIEPILEYIASGKPFLGICVGMQVLLSESDEFGLHKGFDVIPGRVVPFPQEPSGVRDFKVPHIGWSFLFPPGHQNGGGGAPPEWTGTILEDLRAGDSVYFVHSFLAEPADPAHRIADCEYGDHAVCAVVAKDNVTGCQFHPEKSGPVGLRILKRFVDSK
ncbi:MAG TPA: imidazole glycerol phosphate synthase subunit HisH [Candidatus Dormibacteraeota bacterium]|nr:imidazole glycerol phosphate synthase subunit HisH [Candidatus Dormibacteraeota bacterium]